MVQRRFLRTLGVHRPFGRDPATECESQKRFFTVCSVEKETAAFIGGWKRLDFIAAVVHFRERQRHALRRRALGFARRVRCR